VKEIKRQRDTVSAREERGKERIESIKEKKMGCKKRKI
jgi:hypothetical protein